MKYVVLKPNIIWYAFGGCYPIDHETKDFIFYKKIRGDDCDVERISKKNVLFFTDKDISEKIKEANHQLWQAHKSFENEIKHYQIDFEEIYEVQ